MSLSAPHRVSALLFYSCSFWKGETQDQVSVCVHACVHFWAHVHIGVVCVHTHVACWRQPAYITIRIHPASENGLNDQWSKKTKKHESLRLSNTCDLATHLHHHHTSTLTQCIYANDVVSGKVRFKQLSRPRSAFSKTWACHGAVGLLWC